VYLDDAIEGVPLAELAESITLSPGRTTITHAHAAFTIQTWFAPLDRQALVLLLDIETSHAPAAGFVRTGLRPIFPAFNGGQAFPGRQTITCLCSTRHASPCRWWGRPFTRASVRQPRGNGSHAGDGAKPPGANRHRRLRGRREPRAGISRNAGLIGISSRNRTPTVAIFRRNGASSPEPLLSRAFEWAKFAIEKAGRARRVGCGLIGGFSPTGSTDRPGRNWYFGADALLSSWSIADYGDLDRAVLEFLRDHQRADGRSSTGSRKLPWSTGVHIRTALCMPRRNVCFRQRTTWCSVSVSSRFLAVLEKAYRFCVSTADSGERC
jgi:hypothetical protein